MPPETHPLHQPLHDDDQVSPDFAHLRKDVQRLQDDVRLLQGRTEESHRSLSDAIVDQGNAFTAELKSQREDFMKALEKVTETSVSALKDAAIKSAMRTAWSAGQAVLSLAATAIVTFYISHMLSSHPL